MMVYRRMCYGGTGVLLLYDRAPTGIIDYGSTPAALLIVVKGGYPLA